MPSLSCDADREVLGLHILPPLLQFMESPAAPVLQPYQLDTLNPQAWYPLSAWVEVLNVIYQLDDHEGIFFDAGLMLAQTGEWPYVVEDMDSFFGSLHQLDGAFFRGGSPNMCQVDVVEDGHIRVAYNLPYPAFLMMGLIQGMAFNFMPDIFEITVDQDADYPPMEDGSEATVLHLLWYEKERRPINS